MSRSTWSCRDSSAARVSSGGRGSQQVPSRARCASARAASAARARCPRGTAARARSRRSMRASRSLKVWPRRDDLVVTAAGPPAARVAPSARLGRDAGSAPPGSGRRGRCGSPTREAATSVTRSAMTSWSSSSRRASSCLRRLMADATTTGARRWSSPGRRRPGRAASRREHAADVARIVGALPPARPSRRRRSRESRFPPTTRPAGRRPGRSLRGCRSVAVSRWQVRVDDRVVGVEVLVELPVQGVLDPPEDERAGSSSTTVIAAATATTSRVTIGRSPTSRCHSSSRLASRAGSRPRAACVTVTAADPVEARRQPGHVHVDGVAADVDLAVPDLVEEPLPGDHPAAARHQGARASRTRAGTAVTSSSATQTRCSSGSSTTSPTTSRSLVGHGGGRIARSRATSSSSANGLTR